MDISKQNRFGFGKNWQSFLETIDDERIKEARKSLVEWLETEDLSGKSFLDIGSGSGLFSLAARMMGGRVYSFDYDIDSVKCTNVLKNKYYQNDMSWDIEQGDILNDEYIAKYKNQDIVYSWGVLHHTGDMHHALDNAGNLVKPGGVLFVAIYNDQGKRSEIWKRIKSIYNKISDPFNLVISVPCFVVLWGGKSLVDAFRFRPFFIWKRYFQNTTGI